MGRHLKYNRHKSARAVGSKGFKPIYACFLLKEDHLQKVNSKIRRNNRITAAIKRRVPCRY